MTFKPTLMRHTVFVAVLVALAVLGKMLALSDDAALAFNTAVLLAFVVGSGVTILSLIRADGYFVWMPITLFVASSALFFGFGPLSYAFGSDGTKAYLALRKVSASPQDLIDATVLSLFGILCVLIGALVAFGLDYKKLLAENERRKTIVLGPEMVAWGAILIGVTVKYGLVYPANWGFIDFTPPGFLSLIATASSVGFGLLFFVAFRKGGPLILLCFALWLTDFSLTILNFSKTEMVFSMIFAIAGYFLATRRVMVSIALGMIVVLAYVASQPLVAFARNSSPTGLDGVGPAERVEIIQYYVAERPEVGASLAYDGAEKWWTRFEFSAKQAYAMDLRERGQTSSSLEQLPIIFVPRVFWPDKPVIRGPGQDFYFLVTGRDTNRMSISVYADLYWQFGWLGIVFLAPMIGVGLALMTRILLPAIKRLDFIYFPAILIGFRFALADPTKFFINGPLSSVLFFALYLVIIAITVKVLEASGRSQIKQDFHAA